MVLVLSLRSADYQSPNSHSRDTYNIDLPRGGDPDSAQLACAGQLLLRLVVLPASSIDDELCERVRQKSTLVGCCPSIPLLKL